jgi:hypothetical protein
LLLSAHLGIIKETLFSRFVEGVVTLANVVSQMVNNKAVPTDKVGQVMLRHFRKVNLDTTLGRLARIFEKESYAVVVSSERYFESKLNVLIRYMSTFMVMLSHSCAIFVLLTELLFCHFVCNCTENMKLFFARWTEFLRIFNASTNTQKKKCELTLQRPGFISRPFCVEFVVHKLALGQVIL